MRAAIHNPYLDTLGGGERYTISFAKVLFDKGFSVDVEWKDSSIKTVLEKRFGVDLKGINFIRDIKRGDGYDICFWVSDGSIPILRSHKNFLHFQVPFHHVGGNSLLNKMKFFRIDEIICNSLFTKNIIDHEYGVESIIIYPPVDIDQFKPKRKENSILVVGRFSGLLQNKGQEVLIRAFKKVVDGGLRGWKLVFAGGVEVGVGGDYFEKLVKLSGNYPVEIVKSPDFKTLKNLYGKAKIFWSASGFGEDEEKNPEKVEHFGIAAVEAMAAGAVPILFSAGGYKEIVKDEISGFLWTKISGLVSKTMKIVDNAPLRREMAERSRQKARKYSYEEFEKEIAKII